MTPVKRPIRIAVQFQPQHGMFEQLRDRIVEAEQLGVDVVFNWDHFYPLRGEPEGKHFESWTVLAAIAELTDRVEFGPLVNCNSYRNPDLQADMARTIDHISAKGGTGRFIFGTGSGWFEKDYQAYGYEFGTVGSRLNALGEALPRIEARWGQLNPQPTRKIPVLIGGQGEQKTLKLVAQYADIWHYFLAGDVLAHKLEVLAAHCEAVGRDIDEIEKSSGHRDGELDLELFDGMLEQGVTLYTIGTQGPDWDLSQVKQALAWRDANS